MENILGIGFDLNLWQPNMVQLIPEEKRHTTKLSHSVRRGQHLAMYTKNTERRRTAKFSRILFGGWRPHPGGLGRRSPPSLEGYEGPSGLRSGRIF